MKNSNGKTDHLFVIENPVINPRIYTGDIVYIYKGYVFINNIKRNGESISTNGDVFCPIPENSNLKTGQLVKFGELNRDKERIGKFRTEKITLVENIFNLNIKKERGEIKRLIENFVDRLLSAYEEGALFPFLRGELR